MLSSYCLTNKLLNNRELSFVIKPVIRTLCLSRLHYAKRKNESNFSHYFLSKYIQFMERFTAVLDQRFPTTMRVYRQFTWGTKDFFKDVKQFVLIVKKKNAAYPDGFKKLQRHEIELYYQVPKDIAKVTPTLVLSTVPFAFYVLLPLVYLFPRQLLTVHFWTLQQRSEFLVLNQRKKVCAYKPALRCLQAQLDSIKAQPCYEDWEYIIRLLGSGLHPDPRVIIECIPLFVGPPYHTRKIYASHVRSLLRVHGLHPGWRGRTRLEYRSKILFHLDRAIIREGGVSALTLEELRRACAFRGLNPTNLDSEEMINWLDNWIFVSSKVDKDSWSLLLHCPILLSYNHPNNWILIH